VHEGAGDHHPLLLSAGEGDRLRLRLVGDLELGEEAIGPRLALAGGQAEVATVVGQHLAHREVPVEVAGLRHHRDAALRLVRLPGDVLPVDEDPARGGPHEGADAADRRALARPVRPEEAEELSPLDRERQTPERLDGAATSGSPVGLREVLDDEDAHGARLTRPASPRTRRYGVRGDDRQLLLERLRDEQAVERVAVMEREGRDAGGVPQVDGNGWKPFAAI